MHGRRNGSIFRVETVRCLVFSIRRNKIMNKKKTLIIVIASALVVIIGIVAVVLALRGKKQNTVVDNNTTTTVTESADITTDGATEEVATPSGGISNEESGEGKTDSSNENSNENSEKGDAPTNAPTKEEVTEPSGEKEEEKTEPVVEDPIPEGTLAPTAPTEPVTAPPTEAPTPAPTEPPTEAPKPMTDEEKLKAMGVTYTDNSNGGVTITGGNLVGDVVIPATIDGKKVTIGEAIYENTSGITSLVINCEEIGAYAFSGIETLKTVVIGADVKVLGEGAFYYCKNLESVTFLGEQITEIPARLFGNCLKLLSLTLPRSVNKVYAGSLYAIADDYACEVFPSAMPPKSEWAPHVPEFTLYVYREPDLIYEDFIEYREYGSLEEELAACRCFNYKIVYK